MRKVVASTPPRFATPTERFISLFTVGAEGRTVKLVIVRSGREKVAVTDWAVLIRTVQVPVPEQPPPLHPVKIEGVEAVAVKVTEVVLS